jgi:hypothetical protein
MTARVPFAERGGAGRGLLDLATGCYPAFLFGGSIGDQLPVFHFHEVTREWLEPRLLYLSANGYRTVTTDEIARLVIDGVRPGPRRVALTFDDAWESAWSVAFPLLRQHGLRAILFAIPGRVADDHERSPFVTWAQLRELHESGVFDVQSHTRSHAMMFSDAEVVDFVTPAYVREPLLNRPITSMNGRIDAIGADALGTPLFQRRSRMSDGRRFFPDEEDAARCREHVRRNGGADFFNRPNWRHALEPFTARARGRFENDDERSRVIRKELADGRALLNEKLRTTSVKHVALPWGISGAVTRAAIEATGHELAFAERPWRRRSVRAGDDRFELMRLSGRYVTCLPGRNRDSFFSTIR